MIIIILPEQPPLRNAVRPRSLDKASDLSGKWRDPPLPAEKLLHGHAQLPLRHRPRPARRRPPDDLQCRFAQYPQLRPSPTACARDWRSSPATSDIRVVILAGQSEKSMIGGADIKEMAKLDQKSAEAFITRLRDLCEAVRNFPAPVIARMPGWCLGGGLEVAAACDFRIAAHDAMFGMPEVRVGIPSVIHAALLPRLIGWGRARWLVMTAENIDAPTALGWGLVDVGRTARRPRCRGRAHGQGAARMWPRGAAHAKGPAAAMGRTAADGIRQFERRRIRTSLPDRRATADDAGVSRQEEIGRRSFRPDPPSPPSRQIITGSPLQFLQRII